MISCGVLHPPFFYILYRNESALGSTSFVLFRWNPLFLGGGDVIIVQDGARVESIDLFFRGNNLGLVSINKLEQLRKYIFDT
jgi:hypothetical protein